MRVQYTKHPSVVGDVVRQLPHGYVAVRWDGALSNSVVPQDDLTILPDVILETEEKTSDKAK